tara:strand:- start:15550 stop:15693 length:144 start_codon:yes stop_codon:yes gene_type:complete
MKEARREGFGVIAIVVVVLAVLQFEMIPASGQVSATDAWGNPSLEGI